MSDLNGRVHLSLPSEKKPNVHLDPIEKQNYRNNSQKHNYHNANLKNGANGAKTALPASG